MINYFHLFLFFGGLVLLIPAPNNLFKSTFRGFSLGTFDPVIVLVTDRFDAISTFCSSRIELAESEGSTPLERIRAVKEVAGMVLTGGGLN